MQQPKEPAGSKRPALTLGVACALVAFTTLAQAKVQPPPRPPGSSMVRLQGGMNDDEVKRQTRAHKHKALAGKNINVDDSEPGKGVGNNTNDKGSKR